MPLHDIDVYLTVLYVFISLLILGVRRTGSRWTTWYQKKVLLDDSTLRNWYLEKISGRTKNDLSEISEPVILKLAREALNNCDSITHLLTIISKDRIGISLPEALLEVAKSSECPVLPFHGL